MKRIFTIIGLLFCVNSYAQSVFIPATGHKDDVCTNSDIGVYSKFINRFGSADLKFIRIQNDLTGLWTSAFCDCELCHDSKVDSANFVIGIGDSCVTSAHFYPLNSLGSGMVKIKVFARNNRSAFVIGQFSASCTDASAIFIENEKLIVSPNPANTMLRIGFGSGEAYTINIITAQGQVLIKEKVDNLTNSIDISGFNAGLYNVQIESAGKVFYSKFIKI